MSKEPPMTTGGGTGKTPNSLGLNIPAFSTDQTDEFMDGMAKRLRVLAASGSPGSSVVVQQLTMTQETARKLAQAIELGRKEQDAIAERNREKSGKDGPEHSTVAHQSPRTVTPFGLFPSGGGGGAGAFAENCLPMDAGPGNQSDNRAPSPGTGGQMLDLDGGFWTAQGMAEYETVAQHMMRVMMIVAMGAAITLFILWVGSMAMQRWW